MLKSTAWRTPGHMCCGHTEQRMKVVHGCGHGVGDCAGADASGFSPPVSRSRCPICAPRCGRGAELLSTFGQNLVSELGPSFGTTNWFLFLSMFKSEVSILGPPGGPKTGTTQLQSWLCFPGRPQLCGSGTTTSLPSAHSTITYSASTWVRHRCGSLTRAARALFLHRQAETWTSVPGATSQRGDIADYLHPHCSDMRRRCAATTRNRKSLTLKR